MGNTYRLTERFYRRYERFVIDAVTQPVDVWELVCDFQKPTTTLVNMTFALQQYLQYPYLTPQLNVSTVRDRLSSYVMKVVRGQSVLRWFVRKRHIFREPIQRDLFLPNPSIKDVSPNTLMLLSDVDPNAPEPKAVRHRASPDAATGGDVGNLEVFRATAICIHHGVINHAVAFDGHPSDAHYELIASLGETNLEIFPTTRDGKAQTLLF